MSEFISACFGLTVFIVFGLLFLIGFLRLPRMMEGVLYLTGCMPTLAGVDQSVRVQYESEEDKKREHFLLRAGVPLFAIVLIMLFTYLSFPDFSVLFFLVLFITGWLYNFFLYVQCLRERWLARMKLLLEVGVRMTCPKCKYDLRTVNEKCPECGFAFTRR